MHGSEIVVEFRRRVVRATLLLRRPIAVTPSRVGVSSDWGPYVCLVFVATRVAQYEALHFFY